MKPLRTLAASQWRGGLLPSPSSPPLLESFGGEYVAKLSPQQVLSNSTSKNSKLVLVTAITPTPAGEGKTCTSVGLADALKRIGKNAMACLRQPSTGPVFGKKGGAAGGGRSQLNPMETINLHFTGDIHAVGAAHNLLSAMIENHLHWNETVPELDPRRVTWKHVIDMQDRSLRNIVVGLGGRSEGVPREDGFDITVASEIMAILCLSTSFADLKARLGRIVVGEDRAGKNFVTAQQLECVGAMASLLVQAIRPNVVQSLENTLALVHGGPFANIAHGCSSLVATQTAMGLSDYVVTEAGFGADLGAEKFFHIKCRGAGNLAPAAVVVVATVRALKMHGGVSLDNLKHQNVDAMLVGMGNLNRHLENIAKFGYEKPIVAINKFPTDTKQELDALVQACEARGTQAIVASHYADGSEGAVQLAQAVVEASEGDHAQLRFLYPIEAALKDKIQTVAKEIYRARSVVFSPTALTKLARYEKDGFGNLPVCMAKTQYSFSDNAKLLNAPINHDLHVEDVRLSAGAGFVVVLTGSIMVMPGLPRVPAAKQISVSDDGKITGLF